MHKLLERVGEERIKVASTLMFALGAAFYGLFVIYGGQYMLLCIAAVVLFCVSSLLERAIYTDERAQAAKGSYIARIVVLVIAILLLIAHIIIRIFPV